jgi:hypothetical protein
MSGEKPSPGPWRFVEDPEGKFGIYPTEDGKFIAITDTRPNASLIAAAPDLLGELKDVADRFERCCVASGSEPKYAALAVAKAQAAIRKAEGK